MNTQRIKEVQTLLLSPVILSNMEAAHAAKQWLITSKGDNPLEIEAFDLVDIIPHLPLGNEVRASLSKIVIDNIEDEFGEESNKPLMDWYTNEYQGASLQDSLIDIINSDSEYEDALYAIYTELDPRNDHSKEAKHNVLMLEIVKATKDEGKIEGFDIFLEWMDKYKFSNLEQNAFLYALGCDEGAILEEMLETDTYRLEANETLSEFAKSHKLSTLSFATDNEKAPSEKFYCEVSPVDKDECLKGIEYLLSHDNGQNLFNTLTNYINSTYGITAIMEALEEEGLDHFASLGKGKVVFQTSILSKEDQAELMHTFIASEHLLNEQDFIDHAYVEGAEVGAHNDMDEDVDKHSIFELDEKYSLDDAGNLVIEFDLETLLNDLDSQENLLSNYISIENHYMMDDYFQELFNEESTTKMQDLITPYCGWYGFCADAFSDHLYNILTDEIDYELPMAA